MSETKVKRGEVETVREALRGVFDPEMGMSVVDMGLIRDIVSTEEGVEIKMILTTPFCPLAHFMVTRVQSAAESAVDRLVKVTLGTEPWDPSMMKQEKI